MRRVFVSVVLGVLAVAVGLSACTPAAPPPSPTAALKAAEPTKAPAAPTAAPSAAPAAKVDFPQKGKAISIIVGYAAGGGTDLSARVVASQLEKELGTPVQVVNKPGATGQTGMTEVAQATPDGYTIGSAVLPAVITTYLDPERKSAFMRKDLQLLALHVADGSAVAVKADSPFKTVKDVVEAGKANPDKIKFGTTGILGNTHLNILQLQKETGAKFAIVHFDGGNPMKTALLGGHIDAHFGSAGESLPQFKSGEMRFLGIMDKQRSPFYPNVPTLEEQGFPLYAAGTRGYVLPAGTPMDIVNILTGAMKRVMESPEHKQKMDELGLTIRYMDPKQYSDYWADFEEQVRPLMELARAN